MKSSAWRALGRVAVPLAVVAAFVGAVSSPAAAHNRLRSSTPANGATVATPPAEARLTFAERVDPDNAQIAVTDADGKTVDSPAYRVAGASVFQPLRLPRPGRYQIGYRVISTDGHPVQGKISFTVTAVPGASAAPTPSPAASLTQRGDASATPSPDGSTVAADDGTSALVVGGIAALGGLVLLGVLTFVVVAKRRREGR